MGRPGRWTAVQLEASIEAVVAGASYETAELLTGVPQSTVRDHVVRRGLLRRSVWVPNIRSPAQPGQMTLLVVCAPRRPVLLVPTVAPTARDACRWCESRLGREQLHRYTIPPGFSARTGSRARRHADRRRRPRSIVAGAVHRRHRWYHTFMEKTTLYLPEDLKTAVKRAAAERGVSEAEIIRESIRVSVGSVRPRPRGALYSSGQPIARDAEEMLAGFGER